VHCRDWSQGSTTDLQHKTLTRSDACDPGTLSHAVVFALAEFQIANPGRSVLCSHSFIYKDVDRRSYRQLLSVYLHIRPLSHYHFFVQNQRSLCTAPGKCQLTESRHLPGLYCDNLYPWKQNEKQKSCSPGKMTISDGEMIRPSSTAPYR
jgi:hypothetical protein